MRVSPERTATIAAVGPGGRLQLARARDLMFLDPAGSRGRLVLTLMLRGLYSYELPLSLEVLRAFSSLASGPRYSFNFAPGGFTSMRPRISKWSAEQNQVQ